MIEDIAIRIIGQNELALRFFYYLFLVIGGIISGVLSRSKSELQRAPYFFFITATAFGYTLVESVWLQMVPAVLGGYIWILLAVDLLAATLTGYFYGKAAMARSRDAYGHGRNAVLAFVPFANLVLLSKRSRSDLSAERVATIPLITGGLGVFVSLLLLVSTFVLSGYLAQETERRAERMSMDPATEQAALEFSIKANGIDAMLKEIAGQARTPVTINAETRLERIQAVGPLLRRTFIITLDGFDLTDGVRSAINQEVCSSQLFATLMGYGASVREEYVREDGSEIGSHTVTRSICVAAATAT